MSHLFESHDEPAEEVPPIVDVPWSERHNINVAEEPSDRNYRKTPVSEFGLKNITKVQMLHRMGWEEGRGIGHNPQNALMQPVEILPRHHRLGLGADPTSKAGDTRGLVSSTGKGYKYLDEKAVTRDSLGFQVNSEVVVMGGEYRGWEGVVLAIKGDNRGDRRFKVELALNGEQTSVHETQLILKSKHKRQSEQPNQNMQSVEEVDEGEADIKDSKQQSGSRSQSQTKRKKLQWVSIGLQVKIKNKGYCQGRYYNKKVRVHDILDRYDFMAIDVQGNILEGLSEKDIKRSKPATGERAEVIRGEHKGQRGTLIARNGKQCRMVTKDNEVLLVTSKQICAL